jgi:hypothetical protein
MKPCIATWIYLIWVGAGSVGMGLTLHYAAQAYFWKRKYLALRDAPILREIERQLREERSAQL